MHLAVITAPPCNSLAWPQYQISGGGVLSFFAGERDVVDQREEEDIDGDVTQIYNGRYPWTPSPPPSTLCATEGILGRKSEKKCMQRAHT